MKSKTEEAYTRALEKRVEILDLNRKIYITDLEKGL